MKTLKLYDDYPYDKTFNAHVVSCTKVNDGYDVILNQTLFFPLEGGQCCDQGYINDVKVNDVQIVDGVIHHSVDREIEGEIEGEIDFDLRFSNMQNHSGEHILSGLVHSIYGYDNVGFHLGLDYVTVDFNGKLNEKQIAELERKVNEVIWKNVAIHCSYPDDVKNLNYRSKKEIDDDIRIVEIEGVDLCACCAPHVKTTGEIGLFKVVKWMNYKKGVRLFILAGKRALEFILNNYKQLMDISHLLSSPIDCCDEYVHRLYDENIKLKEEISSIQKKTIDKTCSELEYQNLHIIFMDELAPSLVKYYSQQLLEHCNNACIFIGKGPYRFFIASKDNALEILKKLKEHFDVKGGGRKDNVQGTLSASQNDIINVLKESL